MATKNILHADYNSSTTPLDTDRVVVGQAYATTPVLKTITWANIKAFLKTYNDGLYGKVVYSTSYFGKTSDTTLANIPGLTVNVVSSGIYAYEAHLYVNSGAYGGVKTAVSGTATASSVVGQYQIWGASSIGSSSFFGLNSSYGSTSVANFININGIIVVNAAGTLTVQFAQNASNATESRVFYRSWFRVTKMN